MGIGPACPQRPSWPEDERGQRLVFVSGLAPKDEVRSSGRSPQPASLAPLELVSPPKDASPCRNVTACPISKPSPQPLPLPLRPPSPSATRRDPEPALARLACWRVSALPSPSAAQLLHTWPAPHRACRRVRPASPQPFSHPLPACPAHEPLPQNLPGAEYSRPHCRFVDSQCRGYFPRRHFFDRRQNQWLAQLLGQGRDHSFQHIADVRTMQRIIRPRVRGRDF